MRRFKIKYLKSIGKFVLHTKRKSGWRREWGYEFATESMARKFAEGTF